MINRIEEFRKLIENKDRLIDRLDLPEEKKQTLKDFFNKHPNYESRIDWNRRDLSWSDFEDLLATEGKSISQAKKKGIGGLTEGVDYNIVYQNSEGTLYEVLTHLASRILASPKIGVGSVTAKWCISMNQPTYWKQYKGNGYQFFFWIRTRSKSQLTRYNKIALAFNRRNLLNNCKEKGACPGTRYIISNWIQYFDADDRQTLWQIAAEDFPLTKVLEPYITIDQETIDNYQREADREKLESLLNPEQSRNFGFGYSFINPTAKSLYVKIMKMIKDNGPMGKRDILIELTKMRAMPLRSEVWRGSYDSETGRYSGRYVPIDPDAYWQNPENTVSGQYSSLFGALRNADLLFYNDHTRKWELGANAEPYMNHYRSAFED